jgi:hypothetical protein
MQSTPRTVEKSILYSERMPAAKIKIGPEFTYAGSARFILYDVAHVEQHHFVVADAGKRVERLLWFQFEGYLDNNEHRYNYPPMGTMTLNGLTFLHDEDILNIDEDYRERPTSDSAHVVDFLKQQGYSFGGDTMFKRLVWLDAGLRNELMIIYSEDLAPTGFQVGDLAKGGPRADQWSAISQALHRHALASFSVE